MERVVDPLHEEAGPNSSKLFLLLSLAEGNEKGNSHLSVTSSIKITSLRLS